MPTIVCIVLASITRPVPRSRLVRLAQRFLRAEVAVGGDQPADPLVRPEEVVVREVVRDPLASVVQILELHALDEFALHALPQALALAHRFGVVCARHGGWNWWW